VGPSPCVFCHASLCKQGDGLGQEGIFAQALFRLFDAELPA